MVKSPFKNSIAYMVYPKVYSRRFDKNLAVRGLLLTFAAGTIHCKNVFFDVLITTLQ